MIKIKKILTAVVLTATCAHAAELVEQSPEQAAIASKTSMFWELDDGVCLEIRSSYDGEQQLFVDSYTLYEKLKTSGEDGSVPVNVVTIENPYSFFGNHQLRQNGRVASEFVSPITSNVWHMKTVVSLSSDEKLGFLVFGRLPTVYVKEEHRGLAEFMAKLGMTDLSDPTQRVFAPGSDAQCNGLATCFVIPCFKATETFTLVKSPERFNRDALHARFHVLHQAALAFYEYQADMPLPQCSESELPTFLTLLMRSNTPDADVIQTLVADGTYVPFSSEKHPELTLFYDHPDQMLYVHALDGRRHLLDAALERFHG